MDVEQQADDVRLKGDHQKLDYENFIDDDEVRLHRRRRDTDVTDIPGLDVRDELDTQREDGISSWGSSQADNKGATSVNR